MKITFTIACCLVIFACINAFPVEEDSGESTEITLLDVEREQPVVISDGEGGGEELRRSARGLGLGGFGGGFGGLGGLGGKFGGFGHGLGGLGGFGHGLGGLGGFGHGLGGFGGLGGLGGGFKKPWSFKGF